MMQEQLPNYPLKPLGGQSHFRLLRVEKSTSQSDDIVCELQEFDLKQTPPYTALSYTWGPAVRDSEEEVEEGYSDPGCQIRCNSLQMKVSQSLLDALRHVRALEAEVLLLWADALCINQFDDIEKAAQILLMGDIYAGATDVLVFLGSDDLYVEEVLWTHTVWLDALENLMKTSTKSNVLSRRIDDPNFHRDLGIDDPRASLRSLSAFYATRRWFTRAWIAQEVTRANEVRVCCANISLRWEDMVRLGQYHTASHWLAQLDNSSTSKKRLRPMAGEALRINALRMIREPAGSDRAISVELEQFLQMCHGAETKHQQALAFMTLALNLVRSSSCSNLRDKIYSVLGIVDGFFPNVLDATIVPSYTISVEDLYESITTELVRNIPMLSILSYVEDNRLRKLSTLPSWVPDFSAKLSPTALPTCGDGGHFNASLHRNAEIFPRFFENHQLVLTGFCFDKVVEISEVSRGQLMQEFRVSGYLKVLLSLPPVYPNGQSRIEALWRTMITDISSGNIHPAPSSISPGFRTWLQSMLAKELVAAAKHESDSLSVATSIAAMLASLRDGTQPDELPEMQLVEDEARIRMAFLTASPVDQAVHQEQMAAQKASEASFTRAEGVTGNSKRLFRTEKGFVGVANESIDVGDDVCLVRNAQVPFLLRSIEGGPSFRLVGDAYIHGLMHGEMLAPQWGNHDHLGQLRIL